MTETFRDPAVPDCGRRLYRCCGQGIAVCDKPEGHDGMHYAWLPGESLPTEWP